MARFYLAFRCLGVPKVLVNQIANQVRQYDLGRYVPRVCVEKRVKSGEFYLFIAIESSTPGTIPEEVRSTLLQLSFLKAPLEQTFTYEQIQKFAGAELDIHDYARRIAYWRPQVLSEDDPFDRASDSQLEPDGATDSSLLRSRAYDRLMFWLSATGSGSWDIFRNGCRTLGLDQDGNYARGIFRRLRLLGHIEYAPNGKHWSIAPTVFALTSNSEGNKRVYCLCGQRDLELLSILRREADIEELPQASSEAPSSVRIWTSDVQGLTAKILKTRPHDRLTIGEDVSCRLAELLPSIPDWTNLLDSLPGILPHMFRVQKFEGTTFVDCKFDSKSGFYQLWPDEEMQKMATRPKYTLFYDSLNDRWLRGDWYGLRFLTLYVNGESCPVRYDPKTQQAALPADWRWPELYERALVLASGRLPTRKSSWLVYESISPNIIQALTPKMNLSYEET